MRQTTVFVVDDEEQICTLLTRILARDGLRTLAFATPSAALAAVETERPDLLLTDLTMPGMTGLELAAQAKALRGSLSVVVMTGYASLENVVDAMRSGIDDFVTKPFGVAEIREVVQRVLARRAATPADAGAAAAAEAAATPDLAASEEPPTAETPGAAGRPSRDAAALDALHALLTCDAELRDLAERVATALRPVLEVDAALLLLAGPETGGLRVASASAASGGTPGEDLRAAPELSGVLDDGRAAELRTAARGELLRLLGRSEGALGPAAAAPLRQRDAAAREAGLLVVTRPVGSPAFAPAELALLGLTAAGLGHVVSAARAADGAADAYRASLCDVVAATEQRSAWFRDHSARVRDLSVRLGERLGLDRSEIDVLEAAAPLLDLGRVVLGDQVLAKPGRLSPDEWRALRSHPDAADRIVRPLGVLRRAKPVIRHHHENWDGSGYPDGLRGDAIPYLAALVRIADCYAALTSPRPWRAALAPADAVRRIAEGSGTQFHPQLVAAFAELQLAGGEA